MERQIDEDMRMQKNEREGGVTLNSKKEYYTPKGVPVFLQLWKFWAEWDAVYLKNGWVALMKSNYDDCYANPYDL